MEDWPERRWIGSLPDPEWEALKKSTPLGTELTGRIVSVQPFGLFIDFGAPVLAIMDIVAVVSPDAMKLPYDHAAWPKLGDQVTGRVIWFRDRNQQIDLEWLPDHDSKKSLD